MTLTSMTLTSAGPTFVDDEREQLYRRRGIVTIGPVLDPDEVEQLLALSARTASPGEQGIMNDYRRDDRTRMHELRATIGPMLEDHIAELFVDHRLVIASFIVKHPGGDSAMPLHEDRTHVDERRHRGGNLWIPLGAVGADHDNGGLEVLPYSHLLTDNLVGTRTPDPWQPYEPFLRRYYVVPELAAGSAIYYDNRTLHASPANASAATRTAVACLIVPREASLRHVVSTGRRHRVVYEVDDAFFLDVAPHTITADSMRPYDIVDEVDEADEEIALDPERVVAVIAADDPAASVDDARPEVGSPPDGVERGPRRLPPCAGDPPTPVGLPAESDPSIEGFVRLTPKAGPVGVFVLSDPSGVRAEPPAWARAAVSALDLDGQWAALLLLAEGAAVDVEVDDQRRDGWRLDPVDVPWISSRMRVDAGEEILDNRVSLTITPPWAAVWNHGPGTAALLVSMTAAPPTPAARPPDAGSARPDGAPDGTSRSARLRRSLRRLAGR